MSYQNASMPALLVHFHPGAGCVIRKPEHKYYYLRDHKMSVRARREQEKQERRESILDAAERVFFDKGIERSTMDDIAREAQLSRGLLYVYFRDKVAMLEAIMLRAAENLRCRFRELAASGLTGGEQINAMGRAYYAFSLEQPDYFDLLTRAASEWPSLTHGHDDTPLEVCSGEIMDIMTATIQRGLADGSLDPQRINDPEQTAMYLRGALHGVIMLTRQPPNPSLPSGQSPADLVRYTLDMLGASLRRIPANG